MAATRTGTAAEQAFRPTGGKAMAALPATRSAIRNLVRVRGTVGGSLYVSGLARHVPPKVMAEAVRMLGYGVDIERDLRAGDRFELMYEQFFDSTGRVVRTGHLMYASISLAHGKLGVWRFTAKDGRTDYFDARGRSLRTDLLRTPVDAARITSRFGKRRHPILGFTRLHKGVDFAALARTPVYAAGDGVVEVARTKGAYGRYVRLRHRNGYATAYAHLSAFARGIKPGVRVRQGQMIGRVGATGLTTGPHLHFEVLRNGEAVDPAQTNLPPGRVLRGAELAAFRWHAALLHMRPAIPARPAAKQTSAERVK